MDAVQAKATLDAVKNIFRAAEHLSDALDTAVTTERQQRELQANIEHLQKQQAAEQAKLAAQQAAFIEAQTKQGQQQAEKRILMQTEAERMLKNHEYTRVKVEEGIAAAQTRLAELTRRAEASQQSLDSQIATKQAELEKLTASVEALKAQARQVLN